MASAVYRVALILARGSSLVVTDRTADVINIYLRYHNYIQSTLSTFIHTFNYIQQNHSAGFQRTYLYLDGCRYLGLINRKIFDVVDNILCIGVLQQEDKTSTYDSQK